MQQWKLAKEFELRTKLSGVLPKTPRLRSWISPAHWIAGNRNYELGHMLILCVHPILEQIY